jgi:hypothetical protein
VDHQHFREAVSLSYVLLGLSGRRNSLWDPASAGAVLFGAEIHQRIGPKSDLEVIKYPKDPIL